MKADRRIVVFDTNVLLSMLGFPGKRLAVLWEIIQEGKVDLFLSEFILGELSKNLRVKVRLDPRDITDLLRILKGHAQILNPSQTVDVVKEKDADNRILECAVEAKADVLVTGNFKHLRPLGHFQGIAILTPREFLDTYFPTL